MKIKLPYLQLLTFVLLVASAIVAYLYYLRNPLISYLAAAVAASMATAIISLFFQRYQMKKQVILKNRLNMWNTITYKVKKAGETAFNELPIGILVINSNQDIEWANNFAKEIFMSPLSNVNLKNINTDLYESIRSQKANFQAIIYGKIYQVEYKAEYNVLYLTDITKNVTIEKKYQNRLTTMGYINIDNLEDALTDFDVQERAEYMGKIIGIIAKWAENYQIYVRAFNESRYLALMDYQQLKVLCQSNFTILDEMKTINRNNEIVRVTLSMGFASSDISINDLAKTANDQLELALNRGGDQVVVNINGEVTFYGAKTDAKVKDSKVETRVRSQELFDLMKASSNVVVMSHKNIDADGFGASLGMYKMAKALGKEAYIALDLNSMDTTVRKIYEAIVKEYIMLLDNIISPEEAYHKMNQDSLLMIVDTQNENLLCEPRLLKRARRIGVVDHHRKGIDVITSHSFNYTQPYASSSVELVVSLFEFFPVEIPMNVNEANWMLLGMIVDTNNFVYRTTAKTFEVAAMLQKYGAAMPEVKKYLREDISEKIVQNDFINSLEIYRDRIGLAVSRDNIIYERELLAKISDEIISIAGIQAGITVAMIGENEVGISSRSLGEINVQLLMEQLGGGGHLNNAAAQIKDEKIEDVVTRLKGLIDDFINKEDAMKVILIKEVKGRGRKGEVIELQPGFANHLVRIGQAILATPENLRTLEIEKQKEIENEMKFLVEMKELKQLIESKELKIGVRTGSNGKLFGSVSMKQVVDAFEKETGISLDKRKIIHDDNITSLGTYLIPIQLHKDVQAKIKVFVVEKE